MYTPANPSFPIYKGVNIIKVCFRDGDGIRKGWYSLDSILKDARFYVYMFLFTIRKHSQKGNFLEVAILIWYKVNFSVALQNCSFPETAAVRLGLLFVSQLMSITLKSVICLGRNFMTRIKIHGLR